MLVELFLVLLVNNKPTYYMCKPADISQMVITRDCEELTFEAYTQLVNFAQEESRPELRNDI